jgi:hypothetical protein
MLEVTVTLRNPNENPEELKQYPWHCIFNSFYPARDRKGYTNERLTEDFLINRITTLQFNKNEEWLAFDKHFTESGGHEKFNLNTKKIEGTEDSSAYGG